MNEKCENLPIAQFRNLKPSNPIACISYLIITPMPNLKSWAWNLFLAIGRFFNIDKRNLNPTAAFRSGF